MYRCYSHFGKWFGSFLPCYQETLLFLHNEMETYAHMKLYTGMKPAVFPIAKEVNNPSIHEQPMGALTHSQMGFYPEWKRRNLWYNTEGFQTHVPNEKHQISKANTDGYIPAQ